MISPRENAIVEQSQYVRFPPRWQNVLVPTRPARASARAVAMYTACRPVPVAAQHALWLVARAFGGRALPGPREAWRPALPDSTFGAFIADWRDLAGGRLDALAGYERLQSERQTVVLMACAGHRSMLIRVRRELDGLALERQISRTVGQRSDLEFRVPTEVGTGERDGWHWVAYKTMSTRPHRPVRRLAAGFTRGVTGLVESVLPRPAGVPAHWRGCHGDLSPWNLRRVGRTMWLIDWEDAGYAPQGADEVYFRAVAATLRRSAPPALAFPPEFDEAVAYWTERVANRPKGDQDSELRPRLLSVLGAARVS